MTKIAFLGIGRMGEPMARRLAAAGNELTVWSRTRSRAERLAAVASLAPTPAAAVESAEVAVTMLADPPAVDEVMLGRDGALAGLSPGALVVEMSTTGPLAARRLSGSVAARGATLVDAPVAGSIWPATQGTLAIFVGGDPDDVARARAAVLEELGDPERTWHLGPVGAGQAAKLAVNLVLGGVMAAVGEAVALAQAQGLDLKATLDVLERASVASQTVAAKRPKLLSGDYTGAGFRLALMHKDLLLALDAARAARGNLPAAERVADVYAGAKGRGFGDADYSAVAAYIRTMLPVRDQPARRPAAPGAG